MEPYARLKRQLRFSTHGAGLRLHIKRPHALTSSKIDAKPLPSYISLACFVN